ncbi:hemolysin [Candidatus Peregrinibacteria bacterium CG10_big_fil_rev_8_21_14_0_10_55_24]|nr:MAG: hemolysin [Candidatus Peregrinibacteria bacterium CG10_big_fil_rev_8_21_14_0_10_55_24]
MRKDNELLSALTHFLGFLLAIAALVLVVTAAARTQTSADTVGASIFGATLIFLYAVSTVFHLCPRSVQAKKMLQRLDHAAIYVLIAGTYTPVCLTMTSRGWGWSLFGVIWGLAAVGVILKLSDVRIARWFSTMLYIAMGWVVVIAIVPLAAWLNAAATFWLVLGGSLYTTGCFFFLLDRGDASVRSLRMHDVFHLFVIAGSVSHFWAVFALIEQIP